MKPIFFALCAALFFSSCSIHSRQQLAVVRSAGVHSETVRHLAENSPLTPSDLINMKRRGVEDSVAVYHLERVGIDYEARKEDMERLRVANVSDRVRDAFQRASDRFVSWRSYAAQAVYVNPYPWYEPYGFGVGYTYVRQSHRHCR